MIVSVHTRSALSSVWVAWARGYQATDTRLDRVVAVKVLPRLVDCPDLRERFEREARTVAGLLHPNICVLHDIGAEGSLEDPVMEYVEGETLARRIGRGPLSIEDAVRCAIDVARALAEIHRHGIVHRDVKPSNIMLTSDGAKLLDFGIAKLQLAAVVASEQEEVGELPAVISSLFGTPQYMAPEQLEGREVDGRADIFAFGAVLYEMLTGTKAFPSETYRLLRVPFWRARPRLCRPTDRVNSNPLRILSNAASRRIRSRGGKALMRSSNASPTFHRKPASFQLSGQSAHSSAC